jgi:hypothetical protein
MVQTSDPAANQRRLRCFRDADSRRDLLRRASSLFGTRYAGMQGPRWFGLLDPVGILERDRAKGPLRGTISV